MSESLRRVEEGIYAVVLETALPNALAERNRWRQTLKLPGLGLLCILLGRATRES